MKRKFENGTTAQVLGKSIFSWVLLILAILIPYALFKTNSFIMDWLFNAFSLESYSFFNSAFYESIEKVTIFFKYVLAIMLFISLIFLCDSINEFVNNINLKSSMGAYMAQGLTIILTLLSLIISTPLIILVGAIVLIIICIALISKITK